MFMVILNGLFTIPFTHLNMVQQVAFKNQEWYSQPSSQPPAGTVPCWAKLPHSHPLLRHTPIFSFLFVYLTSCITTTVT